MPRVTVLITLYNKGPYVEEAVRSVLASSYGDFELLVIDDASTDDGPARVGAIADPRIRLVRRASNGGRPAAANRGFEEARGGYIAVLDADDVMLPGRLAKQVAFLDAHPEVGVVGSSLAVMGREQEVMRWAATDEEAKGGILFSDPVCYGTAMFRRNVVMDHGIRCDEQWQRPGMDYLFLLSLARHTRFANLAEPLTLYRLGEQNMRHGRDPIEDRAVTYRRTLESFGIEASEDEIRCQLMLHRLWKQPPGAADVRALHAWIMRLRAINRERGLFPVGPFEAELQRRWERLFHRLADGDAAAAFAHMRITRSMSPARLRYLASSALRRFARRNAKAP